jgi:hypothetical protein
MLKIGWDWYPMTERSQWEDTFEQPPNSSYLWDLSQVHTVCKGNYETFPTMAVTLLSPSRTINLSNNLDRKDDSWSTKKTCSGSAQYALAW